MDATTSQLVVFGAKLTEEKTFWLDKFSHGISRCSLPEDGGRAATGQRAFKSLRYELAAQTIQLLHALTADSDFLTYTALHAALKLCLYNYTQSRRVLVGTPALKPGRRG